MNMVRHTKLLITASLVLVILTITGLIAYFVNMSFMQHTALIEQSLSGYLFTFDGTEITEELWCRMSDYGVDNISVSKYVQWLKDVINGDINTLAGSKNIYWFFNDCSGKLPRSMDRIIRIGLLNLSYGACIIISAFKYEDGVDIVVHATIGSEKLWRELLARALMLTYRLKPEDGLEALKITLFRKYRYSFNNPAWAVWVTSLRGEGSGVKLMDGKVLKIRNVFVILEMPIYFIRLMENKTQYSIYKGNLPILQYLDAAELLYWRLIASPALILAVKLAQPPNVSVLHLYEDIVPELVSKIVLRNVGYSTKFANFSHITYSPFLIRMVGEGPCIAHSMASSLFASVVLDAVTANAVIDIANGSHVISLLVLPSSILGSGGEITLSLDIDSDGVNDSATVVVDTADLPIEYIRTHIREVYLLGPLSYIPSFIVPARSDSLSSSITALFYAYFNYTEYLLSSPAWIHLPWSEHTLKIHEALASNLINNSAKNILKSWYVSTKTPSGYVHYWSTPILNISKEPYTALRKYVESVMNGELGGEAVRFGPNSLNLWVNLWINALNHVVPLYVHVPPSKSVWPGNIPEVGVKALINTLPKILETPLKCTYSALKKPLILKCSVSFRSGTETLRCISRSINISISGLPHADQWNMSLLVRMNSLRNLGNITCVDIMFNYGHEYSTYITLKKYRVGPALIAKEPGGKVLIYVPEAHFGFHSMPKLIQAKTSLVGRGIVLIPVNESADVVPLKLNITLKAKKVLINNLKGWYVEKLTTQGGINTSIKFLLTKGLVKGKVIALLSMCLHGPMPKELVSKVAIINLKLENGTLIQLYEPIQVRAYEYGPDKYTCYVISHEVPESLIYVGSYEVYVESLNTFVKVLMGT